MPRRIHVQHVSPGELEIDASEAHHLRDVLRMQPGTPVEVFDDSGTVGVGVLTEVSESRVAVRVDSVQSAPKAPFRLIVASAVPKAARGDWMVEKLSEIGVDLFIPLATERSVVLPEGKNKLDRWQRLANEAAKQSHRSGVMKIAPLTPLTEAITQSIAEGTVFYFSTATDAVPLREFLTNITASAITLFIGPEGGWSPEEIQRFSLANLRAAALTTTILRIETAAIAAAAIVATLAPR